MSEVTATSTASSMQMDYMELLVAQLQNQNPLDPLDNSDMASQMAQFSQLQQLETMNTSFTQVLETVEKDYAKSLIDKTVSFYVEDDTGASSLVSGSVDSVYNDVEGDTVLAVGTNLVSLSDVIAVQD